MTGKRRKLTPTQIQQLRAEYEALDLWDPESEGITGLLARWDISKPTLYRYREQWTQDDERVRIQQERKQAAERDIDKALASLALELAAARQENQRLHSQLEKMQAEMGHLSPE